jgi:hypothetical protein
MLGDNHNVLDPRVDDPRKQRLLIEHGVGLPVYLRLWEETKATAGVLSVRR